MTSPYIRRRRFVARVVVSTMFVALGVWAVGMGSAVSIALGIILICSPLLYLVIPNSYWGQQGANFMRKLMREGKNITLTGPRRLRISSREIALFHDFGHSATYWPAIERVTTTADYMFIYVNSMSAFSVPLRDLRTEHERQIFVDTVTRYYAESRQEPAHTGVSRP